MYSLSSVCSSVFFADFSRVEIIHTIIFTTVALFIVFVVGFIIFCALFLMRNTKISDKKGNFIILYFLIDFEELS